MSMKSKHADCRNTKDATGPSGDILFSAYLSPNDDNKREGLQAAGSFSFLVSSSFLT